MNRKKEGKTLYSDFKTYPAILTARAVFLVICLFGIVTMPSDLTTKAWGSLLAFSIFLVISLRFSKTLERVFKKEGASSIEWQMIFYSGIMLFMLAILWKVSDLAAELQVIAASLVAGFVAGMTSGELVFLSRERAL